MALGLRPPVTNARHFDKDKYLEPMFGDTGQARTKAAMLLLMIDTISSRTCTKPIVGGSKGYLTAIINITFCLLILENVLL